jgi:hypothetical protein
VRGRRKRVARNRGDAVDQPFDPAVNSSTTLVEPDSGADLAVVRIACPIFGTWPKAAVLVTAMETSPSS